MANTSINIAPILSPDITNKLTGSAAPITTLGSQLLAKKNIIGDQTVVANQNSSQGTITQKEQESRRKYNDTIKKAERDFKNKKITQAQYNLIRQEAEITLKREVSAYNTAKAQTQQRKNSEIRDFQRSQKEEQNKIRIENTKLKSNTIKTEVKAKADLAKQVLTNPSTLLLIYPGLGLLITNAFLNFITQRKKLEKQVEDVNLYIDTKVVDEATVIIATNLKNDTIRAINNAIAKLQAIERILKQINTALKVANVALRIIGILLVFLPAVPGAVLKVFEFLNKVIAGLSAILTVCLRILANEILKLKELIERLKQVILKLNNKTLNILTDDQLLRLIQTILPVGSVPPFSTLTAIPVSGSEGFVNIGGRIVPLSSTSAAGSLPPSGIGAGTGTTTGVGIGAGAGIGAGVGTGAGVGAGTGAGTGTGAGVGAGTGAGTGVGVGAGTGVGTGAGTTITPIQSTGGTGIGVVTTGPTQPAGTGVGTGVGTGIGTGAGTEVGTGVDTGVGGGVGGGITTGGGAGIGVGTGGGENLLDGIGTGVGLDNVDINAPLLDENNQPIAINLDDFSLSGLNEFALDELEQLPLELIEDIPTLTGLEQIPSIEDQSKLYKGFRFEIKEEQDPRFVVRGTIKRRYAVAINRQNIEVLKSEYSFTLDPPDLIEQLKLIIDQRNLQG